MACGRAERMRRPKRHDYLYTPLDIQIFSFFAGQHLWGHHWLPHSLHDIYDLCSNNPIRIHGSRLFNLYSVDDNPRLK